MDTRRMFDVAQALAVAKSRRDVPAALALLHHDMLLETPAFGATARGHAENEKALALFFSSFPDYEVALEGHASNGDILMCWGTAHMTMTGDRLGVAPNGLRAELPVFIQFAFKDGLIASERFFFDLSSLCAQSGVSTDAVRRKLFAPAAVAEPRQPSAGLDPAVGIGQVPPPRIAVRTGHGNGPMTPDPRIKAIDTIRTEPLFDMVVDLEPHLSFGSSPLGGRRVLFGAAGGTFEGPSVRGEVLPGGGDWALLRADGTMHLDVHLALRTHDGALIGMTYGGRWSIPPELHTAMTDPEKRHRVDPSRYYFRTTPTFETGAPSYAWLNDIGCVGSGYVVEGGVAYRISQVA